MWKFLPPSFYLVSALAHNQMLQIVNSVLGLRLSLLLPVC